MSKSELRRCAVYTRKSSEEGLEQEFNSLDAQREAGVAFVKSQCGEGWRLVETRYDDGGISGGTLERPGLQRLLQDIDKGRVHVVVVYKVDRLTRSLADFAKLVEVFEKKGVSFVSVTQQFNTTTSMGRLMLNVLLSFAQFEREVTGERIRDKIAASKKKGMWMGGTPPIGYEAKGRKLEVVASQADTVRHIFRRYSELGCITLLARELACDGIRTRHYSSAAGKRFGGRAFSRGHVHRILPSRRYRGEIEHHGAVYAAEHAAIVDEKLWDEVQARIEANRNGRKRSKSDEPAGLLPGKVFDDAGNLMTATRHRRGSRVHRYYVSRAVLEQRRAEAGSVARVPAMVLELAVRRAVEKLAIGNDSIHEAGCEEGGAAGEAQACASFAAVRRVTVNREYLDLEIAARVQPAPVRGEPMSDEQPNTFDDVFGVRVPFELQRRGGKVRTVTLHTEECQEQANPTLVKAIVQGTEWVRWLLTGRVPSVREVARQAGVSTAYVSRLIRYAFLAPEICEAILAGTPGVDLSAFGPAGVLPLDWRDQRIAAGLVPRVDPVNRRGFETSSTK